MQLPASVRWFVLAGGALVLSSPDARGQESVSQVLPSLLTQRVVLNERGPINQDPHELHFFRGSADHLAEVAAYMNAALLAQLATYPVGYSSGGFTYTFDSATATERRTSPSFGPAFADRPLTIGKGRWNVGLTYQHASFDKLEGKNLDSADIRFYFEHNDCCPPGAAVPSPGSPTFEQDLIEASLRLGLTTDTVALGVNYGLTDRLDVGVVVPIVRVDMEATLNTRLVRLGSEGLPPIGGVEIHTFEGGGTQNPEPYLSARSATGLGDLQLRGKFNLLRTADGAGLALAVDLRLPTGDDEDLLGTGATQARFFVIGSGALWERFFPHVNFGYTASGRGFAGEQADMINSQTGFDSTLRQSREVNYTFGFDAAVTPRLTTAFDIIGRTLVDDMGLADNPLTFPCARCGIVPGLQPTYQEFYPRTGNTNLVLGAAGVRFNLTGNLLLQAHALFALRDSGLVDTFTPTIGFEYAF
jgi:hypothetical protein